MILYHGSDIEIKNPDLLHSRADVDFGAGFYTTPLYEQALKWCFRFKREQRQGIISVYRFDEKAYEHLKTKKFDSYSKDWLEFVLNCRHREDSSDYEIVEGGIANDKVFNTVELFFSGLIDKGEALKRLRYEEPNLQVCFRSERALSYLHFERSEEV